MERTPLRSRAVVSAGYDAETSELEVEFSSGRVYRFSGVPAGVYDWLVRVPNKGLYVARNITGLYDYEDVTYPPADEELADLEALLAASLSGVSD
jgi:KTSC domain